MSTRQTTADDEPEDPDKRSNGDRVPAEPVASALDQIFERIALQTPYSLYCLIAERAHVHATTVMRCHQRRQKTVSNSVEASVDRLLGEIRRGESLDLPGRRRESTLRRSLGDKRRVPSERVKEKIDTILDALGLDEQQFLYRYLADQIGLHATTVMRYHRGELRSAPADLLVVATDLQKRVARGEDIPFQRSPSGDRMIVREHTLSILDELLQVTGEESKARLFRQLDDRLCLRPGTVARIYYDHKLRFVRADIHRGLETLVRRTEYDPCQVYQVGERVNHHLFGVGTVAKKVHKDKLLVRFGEGREILLAERVPSDPFLHMRSGGWQSSSPHTHGAGAPR